MKFYPLKFHPIYKERVWGGENLKKLQKRLPSDTVGESWELSANKEGTSLVANGLLAGLSLAELTAQCSAEILGKRLQGIDRFPLLIKFLDARDNLSVQVHPDDVYAAAREGDLGKTELWYIIHAEPGARLVYGLKAGTTRESFAQAISESLVIETLNQVEVKAGDVLFIPAGTVHATGADIVLAEIQQNSNTTYRVYDWDRVGLDGKPRELHIQRALDVIDFSQPVPTLSRGVTRVKQGFTSTLYVHCPYFAVEVLDVLEKYPAERMDGFEILMCVQGSFTIKYDGQEESLALGETALIPACLTDYVLKGKGKIIKTYVAEREEVFHTLRRDGVKEQAINSVIYRKALQEVV